MTKYDGDEVAVRIGTSAADAGTANALTNVESISWDVDQGVDLVAVGVGSRLTEPHAKLIKYSGSLTRWYDEATLVVSGDAGQFAAAVDAYSTDNPTELFIRVTNKTTSKFVVLNNAIGKYSRTLDSPEGYVMETYDFNFTTITGEA